MTDASNANANHSSDRTAPADPDNLNITTGPDALRVFVLAGSSREDSVNTRLASLVAAQVERSGAVVDLAGIGDFAMPPYDGDAETADGPPVGAATLRERLLAAQALVIASPEYNASVPGVVKNAIDWVSRFRPQPFKDKQTLLVSASPSMIGGNRGLWALRIPLEHLGARVYPDMFSLASAHTAFGDQGDLTEPACGSGWRTRSIPSSPWPRPTPVTCACSAAGTSSSATRAALP